MNGIIFYLSESIDVVKGHCTYSDAPWALTSISQLPVWENYDIEHRGHGNVKAILSVDVSNWNENGIKYGKKASECTINEIKEEVWLQLKRSLNQKGKE